MKVFSLEHVPFESPARIADWIHERGHTLHRVRLYDADPLPALEELDLLVVMGGPMSVHDEPAYPWLAAEKRLIERAIRAGRPVLGICLGAQLIADVLGARVYRNRHREIGWHPVFRTPDSSRSPVFGDLPVWFTAFHWHGETFDIPAGALRLAHTEATPNQAFEYGTAWGLQFHLEATQDSIELLIGGAGDEIGDGPYEQSTFEMLGDTSVFPVLTPLLYSVLDRIDRSVSVRRRRPRRRRAVASGSPVDTDYDRSPLPPPAPA
jgi:GMP synthase (glutamine-hydrolysing)